MSMHGGTISEHFLSITDPRVDRTKRHQLIDIITIAICGILCGANSWVEIEVFGKTRAEWLSSFLELPNGIPSHDTIGRVFASIDLEEFERSFTSWVKSIVNLTAGEVVAIDGKTNRRSHNKKIGKDAIHVVSAFAHENGITLGQKTIDKKSNELKAIPKLLKILNVSGCIVTIDAAGCYREVVNAIVKKEADYVIAVKQNQPTLFDDIKKLFDKNTNTKKPQASTAEQSHGRKEKRECWVIKNNELLNTLHKKEQWKKLSSIAKITNTRTMDGKTSTESRYYISSLNTGDAQQMLTTVRHHWSVENSLHWSLDMNFREDESRVRIKNAQENFSLLRKIALNLLKQDTSLKAGIKSKRLKAALDPDYLLKILGI